MLRVPHRRTPHVMYVAHMLTLDSIAHIIQHATAPQGVTTCKLGTMLARSIDHMRISLRRECRVWQFVTTSVYLEIAVCAKQWPITGAPLAVLCTHLWTQYDLSCPIVREHYTEKDAGSTCRVTSGIVQSKTRMKEFMISY